MLNLFHKKKDNNPLFIKVGKKRFGLYQRFIRDLAKELLLWLDKEKGQNIIKTGGEVKVWQSRDLEIDLEKKWEEMRKENELPHPIEKMEK